MNTLRHTSLVIFFLTLVSGSSLVAQNAYDWSQFTTESGTFFTQPLRWDGSDWLKLGLVGAGTFATMQFDQSIREATQSNQQFAQSVPMEMGRIWGEIYAPMVLFGGYALHSLITNDIGTRKIAFEIGQASLYAAAITYTMKFAFGRARPYTNEGPHSYRPFTLSDDAYHSLSSGHATIAFVLSTVLSRNAHSGFLKVLAYAPAVLTVASRVYQDQHWASDNLLGAAVGFFVGTWVVDIHEEEDSKISMTSVFPLSVRIIIN